MNPGERKKGNHSVGKSQAVTSTIALRFVMAGDLPIVLFLNGTEPINRWCDNDKD